MTRLVFFEKPGCINNTRQKKLLASWGHELDVHSLLSEAWTRESLGRFFTGTPESDWFNPTAPALKNGQFVPDGLDREQVLDAMIADPLLIRRPLMIIEGQYIVGFAEQDLKQHLYVDGAGFGDDLESCPQTQ